MAMNRLFAASLLLSVSTRPVNVLLKLNIDVFRAALRYLQQEQIPTTSRHAVQTGWLSTM